MRLAATLAATVVPRSRNSSMTTLVFRLPSGLVGAATLTSRLSEVTNASRSGHGDPHAVEDFHAWKRAIQDESLHRASADSKILSRLFKAHKKARIHRRPLLRDATSVACRSPNSHDTMLP
jgi:hypothetical protein